MPDIESMDDKAFDALKSDMIAGKDVSVKSEPVAADPVQTETGDAIVTDDDADELVVSTDTEDGQLQKQDSVPFGRFERERLRLKEEKAARAAEKADYEARDQARQERLEEIIKSFAQPKVEAEPVIPLDLQTNPVGVIEHTAKQLEEIQKTLTERSQQEEAQRQEQEVFNFSRQEFAKAVQTDPSVTDAYTKLYDSFKREAEAFGLEGNDLANHLAQTEKQHIYYALQKKIPLGDYVKRLAGARTGWTPQAQAAAAAAAVDPAVMQQQIDEKQQIQRSAASLTNAGGSPARTGMPTPQELLDMSPSQYDAWRAKNDIRKAFSA